MGKLRDSLSEGTKRQQVIDEAIRVIDAEVSDKSGISGMAIKAAYSMAKGIAPGIMPRIVNNLLDDFLDALEPYYQDAQQKGMATKSYFSGKASDIANALLGVTDGRAAKANAGALKKGYEKLRPTAQKHVEQAVPRLADLVAKFAV